MSTALLVLSWLLLTAVTSWRATWRGRWSRWWAFGVLLLTLGGGEFWRTVARALLNGTEPIPLASVDAAYLSIWGLVLLPLVRRQLNVAALGATVLSGVAAAAAFGLALDSAGWIQQVIAGTEITALLHLLLAVAGLALRHLLNPAHFHWDYPVWYLGLMALQIE